MPLEFTHIDYKGVRAYIPVVKTKIFNVIDLDISKEINKFMEFKLGNIYFCHKLKLFYIVLCETRTNEKGEGNLFGFFTFFLFQGTEDKRKVNNVNNFNTNDLLYYYVGNIFTDDKDTIRKKMNEAVQQVLSQDTHDITSIYYKLGLEQIELILTEESSEFFKKELVAMLYLNVVASYGGTDIIGLLKKDKIEENQYNLVCYFEQSNRDKKDRIFKLNVVMNAVYNQDTSIFKVFFNEKGSLSLKSFTRKQAYELDVFKQNEKGEFEYKIKKYPFNINKGRIGFSDKLIMHYEDLRDIHYLYYL